MNAAKQMPQAVTPGAESSVLSSVFSSALAAAFGCNYDA
jgi:hypothetical protein